jgi:hypothetical protein
MYAKELVEMNRGALIIIVALFIVVVPLIAWVALPEDTRARY